MRKHYSGQNLTIFSAGVTLSTRSRSPKCYQLFTFSQNFGQNPPAERLIEHVESNALNSWKLNIFKIIDGRISFYCNNLDLLPPKPKFTFRHLKKGIQEFHRKFVLAPADKAANNVVVV